MDNANGTQTSAVGAVGAGQSSSGGLANKPKFGSAFNVISKPSETTPGAMDKGIQVNMLLRQDSSLARRFVPPLR